jgi:hypothetical protein
MPQAIKPNPTLFMMMMMMMMMMMPVSWKFLVPLR